MLSVEEIFTSSRLSQSTPLLGSEFALQEMPPILSSLEEEGTVIAQDPRNYTISIDIHLSDLGQKGSITGLILSYIMSVDYDSLTGKVKTFVTNWILEHCLRVNEDTYRIRQSVVALMYSSRNKEA